MMKILYLDCAMGIAGDMFAAALLDLLPDRDGAVAALNGMGVPHVRFSAEDGSRRGLRGTRLRVEVHGSEECAHGGTAHGHVHGKRHGRGLQGITGILDGLQMPPAALENAKKAFRLVAEAESKVHGLPVDEIHFHEVGTLDAVADVAAAALLVEMLKVDRIVCSPIHVGSGTVECAHGVLPVPSPAAAVLLEGAPVYSDGTAGELCTPTGASLARTFASAFSAMPCMRIARTGCGLGKRDFPRPNVLRAILGTDDDAREENVCELACDVDDMTGEELAFAAERLFAAGALDVTMAPVTMKKGRPGVTLRVLCRPQESESTAGLMFLHTTTLGVRETLCRRRTMERRTEEMPRPDGSRVRVKRASGFGSERAKIEFDDAAEFAVRNGLSLRAARAALARPPSRPGS